MAEIGEVYKETSSGPRTEPWGTPTEHGLGEDIASYTETTTQALEQYGIVNDDIESCAQIE